jgi:hypothetical protein
VQKCVRDQNEGRHCVRGPSAVKMGPVTFTVTSRHSRDFCDLVSRAQTSHQKETDQCVDGSNR